MTDESTSHLAQSRTFQISPTSGEVIEIELPGAKLAVVALTNTTVDAKYKILELLGEGGMGAVYRARHLMLEKDIALKTFRSSSYSPEAFERFNREVRAVAKLAHPNIVLVFDSGVTETNQPYYTMELLVGQSLEEKLKKNGALSIDEALTIFTEVAEGLKSAHNNGIVHRDLKPGNIFLSQQSMQSGTRTSAKVVDFGIAKLADNSPSKQYQTTAGAIFGSPLYMSPEQSRGDEVDQRSDIYSFGCALFEALTGEPPLVGGHALETMILHQTTAPPRLSQRLRGKDFPPLLESFVGRLLHKKPEQRPQSFEDILDALRRVRKLTQAETQTTTTALKERDAQTEESFPGGQKSLLAPPILLSVAALVITGAAAAAFILWHGSPPKSNLAKRDDAASNSAATVSESAKTAGTTTTTTTKTMSSSISPATTGSIESSKPDAGGENLSELRVLDASDAVRPPPPRTVIIHPGEKEYDTFYGTLSAKGFDVIAKSSITELSLKRCQFENTQFKKLSGLQLHSLTLSRTGFDDVGAAALGECKTLNGLRVDGTQVTDQSCLSMAKYPSLMFLDISRTRVTDAGLAQLAKIVHLNELRLNNNNSVTINGLTRFCEQCKDLKELYIFSCSKIDTNQLRQLRARFPRVKVHGDDEPRKPKDGSNYFN